MFVFSLRRSDRRASCPRLPRRRRSDTRCRRPAGPREPVVEERRILAAASRSATRSSGRSTAARMRRSSTTGSRIPAWVRAANTATSRGCSRRATSALYRFVQHETNFTQSGQTTTLPAKNSYEVTGAVTQALRGSARARMRLDYFSDVLTQQLYHQNVYMASRRSRLIEGGVSDVFGPLAATFLLPTERDVQQRTSRFLYGSTPRASAILAPQQLFGAPIYASLNSEFALPAVSIRHRRRRDARQHALAGRCRAVAAGAPLAVDVPVGEHQRGPSHDLLLAKLRLARRRDSRVAPPRLHAAAHRHRRPGLDEDLGYPDQRLRRAHEARDRAGLHPRLHDADQQLPTDARPDRHLGFRRRRHIPGDLRADQSPSVSQQGGRRGAGDRRASS